ncbi:MAG: response regulator [Planctomycetes bacterium]|nr:response regulator [Planctomycetota bacterium]
MQPIRTLILDDDVDICRLISRAVAKRSYADVEVLQEARQALAAHEAKPFDLMVVDWMMPDMDGLELCRRVRALPNGQHAVILVVTSCSDPDDLEAVLASGANDYLAKPFQQAQLDTRLAIAERNAAAVAEREAARAEADSLNQRLLDVARKIGMAEIATGALHNVGNVLNSVNVSASVVCERLAEFDARHVQRVADMIEEHSSDLAGFLATDRRCDHLVDFLRQYCVHVTDQQQRARQEIRQLVEGIDHIKKIISAQQAHAGVTGPGEPVSLAALIEDALQLNMTSLHKHGIEVIRQFDPIAHVMTEKSKVLPILVNLIKNAKEALTSSDQPRKKIWIRILARDESSVRVEVEDNGVGVAPDVARQIFSYGFTTKSSGHGFGLHSCAAMADSLGGGLLAKSDGPGRGATFVLDLPLQTAAITA